MKAGERLRRRLVARHSGPRKLLVRVPLFRQTETVEAARRSIERRHDWESVNYIYLVDASNRVQGVVSIKELLNAPTGVPLRSIATKDVVSVHPSASVERVAVLAIHHGVKAIPVVGSRGQFLGVIGTDEILEILQHAGIDDAIRYAGIHIEHRRLLDVLHGRVFFLARRRLPWLLAGLCGGLAASAVISQFEGFLREVVELSFFAPAVIYMGAAVGAQAQALFLRSITIGEVRLSKFLAKELLVDMLIGVVLGLLSYVVVAAFIDHRIVPIIVGLAMFWTVAISGLVAVAMTVLLAKQKKDPALGAGPFATVIQDFVSVVVYFFIAALLLR